MGATSAPCHAGSPFCRATSNSLGWTRERHTSAAQRALRPVCSRCSWTSSMPSRPMWSRATRRPIQLLAGVHGRSPEAIEPCWSHAATSGGSTDSESSIRADSESVSEPSHRPFVPWWKNASAPPATPAPICSMARPVSRIASSEHRSTTLAHDSSGTTISRNRRSDAAPPPGRLAGH